MEPDEYFIRGVLQAGVRLVELPCGLGGQLTELVAIRNVGECPIDQIGTHENFLSFLDSLGAVPHEYSHWTPVPQSLLFLLTNLNDAQPSKKMQKCATHDSLCFPLICSAWNWQLDVRSCTPEYPGKRTSGFAETPLFTGSGTPETFVLEVTEERITPGRFDIIVNYDGGQHLFS
jgi:hypothetical protein